MCGATLLLTRAPWAQTGRGAAEFKDEMRRGAPKFGLFINSVSPAVAQRLAAGYSWVAVDLKHGPVAELPALLRAIKAGGAKAMVRVGDQRAGLQEALDLGADGVVVPCRNATEVSRDSTEVEHFEHLGPLLGPWAASWARCSCASPCFRARTSCTRCR